MNARIGRRTRRTRRTLAALAAVLAFPAIGTAQESADPLAAAERALERCVAAAADERRADADGAAAEAERLFRTLAQAPATAAAGLTGQARVRSQCRIPFVNFMAKGELLAESNDLLERALRVDPRHFAARFALGMNHYHSPGFMRRADAGIAAFETLLEQYGGRPIPMMKQVYLVLGDLYARQGRASDALDIWARGAAEFPDEPSFAERRANIRAAAGTSVPAEAEAPAAAADASSAVAGSGGVPAAGASDAVDLSVFDLDPLVVHAGTYSMDDPRASTTVTRMQVYTTPGGSADILQTFQTMPGVTRATEGSDLYVRGGDPAETPVWVDGLRLPYASTFESLHGGLFGVLDPSVLKKAYFSSGGFSARYGDALSGVLDLETDGRPEHVSWRAGANVVSAGGAVRLPLGDRTGAWAAVSGTETTALLAMQDRSDEYPSSPRSAQGIVSLIVEPTESLELRATALREADHASSHERASGHEGAFVADGDTWMTSVSGRLRDGATGSSLEATVGAAARGTGFSFGALDWSRDDRSASLRLDGDHLSGGSARVRAGLEAARHTVDERGVVPADDDLRPGAPTTTAARDDATHHVGGYVEAELRVTNHLGMTLGLRADRLPGESAVTVDPRAAVVYRMGDRWSARAGTGIFHQGRWRTRLELPDPGRPTGVPRRAAHFAGSLQREGDLGLRAEAYVKRYDRYVPSDVMGATGPAVVAGEARGLDVLVSWDDGGTVDGWLAYSLLDGTIELADGRDVSSSTDVTHTLTLVTRWVFADGWQLGGTARYATGRPVTAMTRPTVGESDTPAPVYGEPNGDRLPVYFRLDGRVTRVIPMRVGFAALYLEALNVLDRGNVMAYTHDDGGERLPVESFFGRRTLVFGVEAQF